MDSKPDSDNQASAENTSADQTCEERNGRRCDYRILKVTVAALVIAAIGMMFSRQQALPPEPNVPAAPTASPLASPPAAPLSTPVASAVSAAVFSTAVSSGAVSSAVSSVGASLASYLEALRAAPEGEQLSVRETISGLTATAETKAQFAELVRKGGDEGVLGVLPLMRLGTEGVDELIATLEGRSDDEEYFDAVTTEAGLELSDENRAYLTKLVLEQSSDIAQEILRKADLIESERVYGEPDE